MPKFRTIKVRKHTRKGRKVKKHDRRIKCKRFGTIKRGKVKFKLGSKQHRFLHARKLPHEVVTKCGDKKSIKRFNEKKKVKRRAFFSDEPDPTFEQELEDTFPERIKAKGLFALKEDPEEVKQLTFEQLSTDEDLPRGETFRFSKGG